ncbi:MAG: methyltransferase domain-containing protein [Candidatus Heimdallarchaeota archaeon]|nr:methyltransferase domain-containing protein [Candidatus Heimdallarchaeota archaeon]MCK4876456.1 methyltransferase domain-containing protein [Candidatus Heimdallarchaeota archaeon]
MPKKSEVEKLYDEYAQYYDNNDKFIPETFDTGRAAMSFADDITWHFMKKYAPKDKKAKILDAGAGDGYWTIKFIELGYRNITLSDLSEGMLEQAKKKISKIAKKHNCEFVKSDIADMNEFQDNSFDYIFSQYDPVSLCMKPKNAIKELARIVKNDCYISVVLDTKFRRVPELIEAKQIDKAVELLKTNISYDFTFPQYNLTWEELAAYFELAGLEVIEVVGAPVFMHQIKENILKELEENQKIREVLLGIELEYCTNKTLVNFAGHLQMIGKKHSKFEILRDRK